MDDPVSLVSEARPWTARLAGVVAGAIGWRLSRGAMLPALGAGFAGLLLAWWVAP